MLDDLEHFSYLYQLIGSGTHNSVIEWANQNKVKYFANEYNAQALNRAFDALNLFGVSQTYPVIIKALTILTSISSADQREKLAKKFLVFVETIEKYHFINNAVSQRPGNEVEKYYADKCSEEIKGALDLDKFFKSIYSGLKEKLVSSEEFLGRFIELSYDNDFTLIYYIHDRLNNQERKGGQYIHIYNPDRKILKRNFNIDHLVSQDLSAYKFQKDDLDEDILHSIGNLLVVSLHTNSLLGSMNIVEKFDILKRKEVIPEAARFVNEWGKEDWSSLEVVQKNITKRAEDLGKRAFEEVWQL